MGVDELKIALKLVKFSVFILHTQQNQHYDDKNLIITRNIALIIKIRD